MCPWICVFINDILWFCVCIFVFFFLVLHQWNCVRNFILFLACRIFFEIYPCFFTYDCTVCHSLHFLHVTYSLSLVIKNQFVSNYLQLETMSWETLLYTHTYGPMGELLRDLYLGLNSLGQKKKCLVLLNTGRFFLEWWFQFTLSPAVFAF